MSLLGTGTVYGWRWILAAGCMGCPLLLLPALASETTDRCAPPSDLQRLSGLWQAGALVHVKTGVADSEQLLQLQVGADGRITGERKWEAINKQPGATQGRDRLGQPAFRDVQPVIGWIEARNCRIVIVETEDRGRASGWLRRDASGPVLELEISQSGEGAVVLFADFRPIMKD